MLELTDITLQLVGAPLIENFSLRVAPGEVQTLMGPSGCGKSTLLSAIAGTLSPPMQLSGKISLNGRSLLELPQAQRRVGLLFQDDLLFPHFNVAQNLKFALPKHLHGQANQLIEQALQQADMDGFAERDIASLSGGQRARISALRCLLAQPEVLLLDEPFSKLDPELRGRFREFVHQQIQRLNIPVLLVTHDPEDALQGKPLDLASAGLLAGVGRK